MKIHFITGLCPDFGGKLFHTIHLLAVLSAKMAYPDSEVCVYYQYAPSGALWEAAKYYVTAIPMIAPTEVFGHPLIHHAHKTDLMRLDLLLEHGGIYFDLDTLVYRPVAPPDKALMGLQAQTDDSPIEGLCNAFIAAPPHDPFLQLWRDDFADFDNASWAEHAVYRPWRLAREHPNLIHVKPRHSFFYPHYDPDSLCALFVRVTDVSRSYSIHLWETLSWSYVRDLTIDSLIHGPDTTYSLRARKVLAHFGITH